MTAIRVCIIFVAVFFFLPYGVGRLFVSCGNKLYPWILGLCTCFLFYELLYLIFHITLGSLTVMTFLWFVTCITAASVGFWRMHHIQANVLSGSNNIRNWGQWDGFLLFVVVSFFLLQAFNTVFRTYYGNLDDHYYCAIATTSLSTDTVNRYSPISGLPKSAFYEKDYTLPAWPTFSASLALLTGVHPAIIYRPLLPLVETPAASLIADKLAKEALSGADEMKEIAAVTDSEAPAGDALSEAMQALKALGYSPQEAASALKGVAGKEETADEMIKLALRHMAQQG